jgi:protein-L-isoaspartate(D-aspartate) O-methyltransferase
MTAARPTLKAAAASATLASGSFEMPMARESAFRPFERSSPTAVLVLAAGLSLGLGGCRTVHQPESGNGAPAGPAGAAGAAGAAATFEGLRHRMVREQLETRAIRDPRVLEAMRKVPRHRFVPPDVVHAAYEDGALPIGLDQTISQPFVVAYMTQALELTGSERVLEIGTGSGYQAAILAELARVVYTIEIVPPLAERARLVLDELGYRNIRTRTGDGYRGWPEEAPFDRIVVTAAPPHVPQALVDQLADGGRMVIPVGRMEQELSIIERTPQGITRRTTIPVRFVPMTGQAADPPRNH